MNVWFAKPPFDVERNVERNDLPDGRLQLNLTPTRTLAAKRGHFLKFWHRSEPGAALLHSNKNLPAGSNKVSLSKHVEVVDTACSIANPLVFFRRCPPAAAKPLISRWYESQKCTFLQGKLKFNGTKRGSEMMRITTV